MRNTLGSQVVQTRIKVSYLASDLEHSSVIYNVYETQSGRY